MDMKLITGICAAMLLSACAGGPVKATAEQCTGTNWFEVGKAHGTAGQSMLALNTAINACAEHDIKPDRDAYVAGRAEGLKTYCEPASLVEATIQAKGDAFSCEPFTAQQKTAFETGRDTRAAVARYQQYEAQYKQLTDAKAKINEEGAQRTQQYQQASETTNPTKQQLADRINYLREQLKAVDAQLAEATPVMAEEKGKYDLAVSRYERFKSSLAQ
jgi:hypothetical protein